MDSFNSASGALAAVAALLMATALPAWGHGGWWVGERGWSSGCDVPRKVTTVIYAPYSHHHELQLQPPYGLVDQSHSSSGLAKWRTSTRQPGSTNNPGYVGLAASSFQFSRAGSYWTCSK